MLRTSRLVFLAAVFAGLAAPLSAQDADDEPRLVVHEFALFVENDPVDGRGMLAHLPPGVSDYRDGTGQSPRDRRYRNSQQPPVPSVRGRSIGSFLFFDAREALTADVRIDLDGGTPLFHRPGGILVGHTNHEPERSIRWPNVRIDPRATARGLRRWQPSQWPAAWPLMRARVESADVVEVGNERERFLFYGATLDPSTILLSHASWDGHHVVNVGAEPLRDVWVFGPRSNEPVRIDVLGPGEDVVLGSRPAGDRPFTVDELVDSLVGAGLRGDEAGAMAALVVETRFVDAPGVKVLYRVGTERYEKAVDLEIEAGVETEIRRVALVLSYDLDHAVRSTLRRLAGPDGRQAELRRRIESDLADLIESRVEAFEPLTPALRDALTAIPKDERFERLRRRLHLPPRHAEGALAAIEAAIEVFDASLFDADGASLERRDAARERLRSLFTPYLYSGHALTPALRRLLEDRRVLLGGRDPPVPRGSLAYPLE